VSKTVPCPTCHRKFGSEEAVNAHKTAKHGAPHPFGCEDCTATFRSAPELEKHRQQVHPEPPVCIECGGEGVLVTGREIYPHRPDLYAKRFYRCGCGAYCGCHPGTAAPLGHPCGPVTRKARSAAHAAFDPLWKRGTMNRHQAYAWLSDATGIPRERCHIGMMTAEQAQSVVEAVAARGWERAA
jgi:hypothetical protein